MKIQFLNEKFDEVKGSVSGKTLRAVDLTTKKGASSGLLFYQLETDMNFDLNKSEFRDAVKLSYDIQMQTPIEIWTQTRYSGSTKRRRSSSTQAEC